MLSLGNWQISFGHGGYLLLLLLLPVIWWFSFRAMAVLGPVRRWMCLLMRSAGILLLIAALAEVRMARLSDRLAVIFVLDQSQSIPLARRNSMLQYVNSVVARQRNRDDYVGVVVFASDAHLEIPPFDDNVVLENYVNSDLNANHTDISGAIKLALGTFPENAARRIVIISDGNENLGDALEQARMATNNGVSIDVVPIRYDSRSEVIVERIVVPTDVNKGKPFDLRVIVNNTTPDTEPNAGVVTGRLLVTRQMRDAPVVLADEHVELAPGKRVIPFRMQLDDAGFYSYSARFIPDDPAADAQLENNLAFGYTQIRGRGQILMIVKESALVNQNPRPELAQFVERMRKENLEVTVMPVNLLFSSLAELQIYDAVILDNIAREELDDDHVSMLVRNVHEFGAGLVMLGGPTSFGAGGWTNSLLEEAMPVDFQIHGTKITPKGALVMVMHASEIANGNYWQKVIAKNAVNALGANDYCGVITWQSTDRWLWSNGLSQVGPNRQGMLSALDRMAPGDMPDFDPGLAMAMRGFLAIPDAAIRHMIVISDGDPSDPTQAVVQQLANMKVTVSTVAVASHGKAESQRLAKLASATGGKYYEPNDPQLLPQIFQQETRTISRSLIFEREPAWSPRLVTPHEIVSGLEELLPPITGFVRTSRKQNPLVTVSVESPLPAGEDNPIVASWTYGLGRTVAITTDSGPLWAKSWLEWQNYNKLFAQAIGWAMRPSGDNSTYSVATTVEDGKGTVIVTALGEENEFVNLLKVTGSVVDPKAAIKTIEFQQVAPGRYKATFDAIDPGNYLVSISPGEGMPTLRSGVSISYSREFREQQANEALLTSLASMVPSGGQPGAVLEEREEDSTELEPQTSFRHDLRRASSSQEVWHQMLYTFCFLFLCDIALRRISVDPVRVIKHVGHFAWNLLRRESATGTEAVMTRLKSRKAEVADALEQRRAAMRFAPEESGPVSAKSEGAISPIESISSRPIAETPQPPAPAEQETYTERLLKAKRRVREGQEPPKDLS